MTFTDDMDRIRARLDQWAHFQRGPSVGPSGYPPQSATTRMEPATDRKRTRNQRVGLDGKTYATMPSDLARLTPAIGIPSRTMRQPSEMDWPEDVMETSRAIAQAPSYLANAVKIQWLTYGPNSVRSQRYSKTIGVRVSQTTYEGRVQQALCWLHGSGL